FASMGEDGRAIALDMLIEPDAGAGLGHDRRERCRADLKRIEPQVVAVQFNEFEGVQEYALVSALVTDETERGNAIVTGTRNCILARAPIQPNSAWIGPSRSVMKTCARMAPVRAAGVAARVSRHPASDGHSASRS